jgi:cytochrome c553
VHNTLLKIGKITERSMKNTVFSTLISLSTAFFASSAFAGDIALGESQANACAVCHGENGNSLSPAYPKLAGLGEKYLLKQLNDIKAGTRNVAMMAGQLDAKSDAELDALAAYYASQTLQLSGAKELTVRLNSGQEVDALVLGETIYRSGNHETKVPACSGCHSPSGKGNGPAGYPRLGGQHADYISAQLKAFRSGVRDNDGDSRTMRSVAKLLSDAEVESLANYIAGLN